MQHQIDLQFDAEAPVGREFFRLDPSTSGFGYYGRTVGPPDLVRRSLSGRSQPRQPVPAQPPQGHDDAVKGSVLTSMKETLVVVGHEMLRVILGQARHDHPAPPPARTKTCR